MKDAGRVDLGMAAADGDELARWEAGMGSAPHAEQLEAIKRG